MPNGRQWSINAHEQVLAIKSLVIPYQADPIQREENWSRTNPLVDQLIHEAWLVISLSGTEPQVDAHRDHHQNNRMAVGTITLRKWLMMC